MPGLVIAIDDPRRGGFSVAVGLHLAIICAVTGACCYLGARAGCLAMTTIVPHSRGSMAVSAAICVSITVVARPNSGFACSLISLGRRMYAKLIRGRVVPGCA